MTTASAASRPLSSPGGGLGRSIAVLAAVPLTIVGNMAGVGVFGGTPIQDAAGGAFAVDASQLTPATPAFSIWSAIYLGVVAYGIWQLLPPQRRNVRVTSIAWPAVASFVLNAAWILTAQADLLAVTLLLNVALLVALVVLWERLRRVRPSSWVEALVVDVPFGLYFGWSILAATVNVAASLAAWGVRVEPFEPAAWAVLAAVAAIGVAVAIRYRGRLSIAAAIVWGLSWVGVARTTGELESVGVAVAAAIACVVVAAAAIVVRLRSRASDASA